MGSEFAFEDLSSFEVEKFRYNYLRDEVFNGVDTYVVETVPVDKYSGYSKRIIWIDKAQYRNQKMAFYDRRGALLKTLISYDYKPYLGKYWRADKMHMENHQTGKQTLLTWKNYQFNTGLTERDFNKNSLKRAR